MNTESRDRIEFVVWDEFVQSKSWEQYISDYTGSRMDWRKYYNVAAICLAIIGGSTWGVWKSINAEWVTPLIFGILGLSQLLSAVQKDVVINSEDLQSLMNLRVLYIKYTDKLERLYLHVNRGDISTIEIENQYFEIRKDAPAIEELKDSLNIKSLKKLDKQVYDRVRSFLESRYGIISNSVEA